MQKTIIYDGASLPLPLILLSSLSPLTIRQKDPVMSVYHCYHCYRQDIHLFLHFCVIPIFFLFRWSSGIAAVTAGSRGGVVVIVCMTSMITPTTTTAATASSVRGIMGVSMAVIVGTGARTTVSVTVTVVVTVVVTTA